MERLPTVIWRMPLSDYMDMTLAEIRRLKPTAKNALEPSLKYFTVFTKCWRHVPHQGHLRIDVRQKVDRSMRVDDKVLRLIRTANRE